MRIDERKYPFKWMPRIVEMFEGIDKGLSSFQIARTIGSCSPDASEVLKLMVYLTSFGKVVESDGNWKIIVSPFNIERNQSRIRIDYIKGLDLLIQNLSNDFVPIEELISINGRDTAETQKELEFLSLITKKGQFFIERKRFPQKFAFKPWEIS
ncbi:hypothetical protein CEE45_14270 [Candidatus Heimdallarchaeota archaeon B3_Heim]|nr:MAG: hypothetical protein CEE45_14270 [Candidatus Heimdallarchaeota archaeon B3_Heim]